MNLITHPGQTMIQTRTDDFRGFLFDRDASISFYGREQLRDYERTMKAKLSVKHGRLSRPYDSESSFA